MQGGLHLEEGEVVPPDGGAGVQGHLYGEHNGQGGGV